MLGSYFQRLLSLLLPSRCAACHKANALFCGRCWDEVEWIERPICRCCGCNMAQSNLLCSRCYHQPTTIDCNRAAVFFGRPIRRAIHALKYTGNTTIAPDLANIMALRWQIWSFPTDLIMPIPLHPAREIERGFNQSALLAQLFADQVNLPIENNGVFRIRPTEQQAKQLNRQARVDNVAGAFMADPYHVKNKRILLIDDVTTTGATLEAAAKGILNAGAQSVSSYCVARSQSKK